VIEEELILDLQTLFDNDLKGEVVHRSSLQAARSKLEQGAVLLAQVLLDGPVAVARNRPEVLRNSETLFKILFLENR
jgi:hypothetical protein